MGDPSSLDPGTEAWHKYLACQNVGACPTAKMVVLGLLDILQKLLDNAAICDYEERQRGDGNS